jgi:TPP-dependent pyruvate/acetoin dehydrogenase alpha subunit
MDRGDRISYMVLKQGVPVESSDGGSVGQVKRVLQVPEKDVFDGIVLSTPQGDRFADADDVAEIYENLVVLRVGDEAAAMLPRPGKNAGTMSVSPEDATDSGVRHAVRRAWNRISGNY